MSVPPYFHVRIIQKSNRSHDEVKLDLSEEQLRHQFLDPYEAGEAIVVKGKTIPIEDLERILVNKSGKNSNQLVAEIRQAERGSSTFVVGGTPIAWKAAARAEDVTDEYILGPPGVNRRKPAGQEKPVAAKRPVAAKGGKRVFVVHGHDSSLRNDVEVFLRENGLEPIVLQRQPDQGLTIIEKLHEHGESAYAIVLATPDDLGVSVADFNKNPPGEVTDRNGFAKNLDARARQNVLFEWGFLIGQLGRERVCCIYKAPTKLPSDLQGLIYKEVNESIEEIGYSLIKEFRAAGIL